MTILMTGVRPWMPFGH